MGYVKFLGSIEYPIDAIFSIVEGCGEWILWCQTIRNIEDRVVRLLSNVTAELVIAAMQGNYESAAMEIDKYGTWLFACFRPVNICFDRSRGLSAGNLQDVIGIPGGDAYGESYAHAHDRRKRFQLEVRESIHGELPNEGLRNAVR